MIILVNITLFLLMPVKLTVKSTENNSRNRFHRRHLKTSVYDITNKILSRDLDLIIDVVMWPKFDCFSISIKEVLPTLIL